MFQNKTKLQRGMFVWLVERAGNNKHFLHPLRQVLNTQKILRVPKVRGATQVHILDTNCSAFYS